MKRRAFRLVIGLGAMALPAAVWFGMPGARAAPVEETAAVTRQAYFTHPLTEALPPLLLNGFPPSTVCLVAGLAGVPQACGEEVADIVDTIGLGDGLPVLPTPDADVIQVVLPGTTPVGMIGGQQRYASLLQFQLPTPPAGEEFTSFELILDQEGVNFAAESPVFRELVLATVLQVEEPDPNRFVDVLRSLASGETEAIAQTVTGIEACPVTEGWNAGDAQNAGIEGTDLPDANCILGTTGTFDPATGTWVFDLTFAVQAWTEGTPGGDVLPNEGIMLRPVGAPNVAYGDPDLSTNFQISLADADAADPLKPRIRYTTAAALEPVRITPAPAPAPPSGTTGFTPAPVAGGNFTPAAPAASTGFAGISARWAESDRDAGAGRTPWWLWLLVPIGLGGAALTGEALFATPLARYHRPGAMTRLMRLRGVDEETT